MVVYDKMNQKDFKNIRTRIVRGDKVLEFRRLRCAECSNDTFGLVKIGKPRSENYPFLCDECLDQKKVMRKR